MYSRYGNDSKRPVRLPEHYGGSAFLQGPTESITVTKREPPPTFSRVGIGEKVSPTADRLLRAEAAEEASDNALPVLPIPDVAEEITEEKEVPEQKEEQPPSLSIEKKSPTSPINFEGLRRLLGGTGEGEQDRLLLLGLILLLSRSGEDSDILLWLSLLLLCG